MDKRTLNRRDFLRLSAITATGAVIAACAPTAPQVVEVEKPVIVEKEVVKEVPVERVVEKEVVKEVEKIVTVTPKPVEKIELLYSSSGGGFAGGMEKVWYDECLPVFQEEHPNIQVEYTPSINYDKLVAAFVAGNAPDIVSGHKYNMPFWAELGQLLNLSPYMERDLTQDDIDDWYAAQLATWWRTEPPVGQFSLPRYCGILHTYYNMDAYDEVGIDYPPRKWKDMWTWDEYLEEILKLVKKDASGKTTRWGSTATRTFASERPQMIIRSYGGHVVDPEDNTHCVLGEPEAQEALWWLYDRTWKDDGYPQQAEYLELSQGDFFNTGKTAMSENGPWAYYNTAEQCRFRWNIAPFPKGPVDHRTLTTTDGYGIWSGTKYPDAAWELMKFVTSRFMVKILCKVKLWQPSRKSVLLEYYGILRENFPVLEDVDLEVCGEGVLEDVGTIQEIFKKVGPSQELLIAACDRVFVVGDMTPEHFKDVCEEITTLNREA
jgi:ABC-type glycerol-3-phosphate transport system substrate-binding protein